MAGDDITIADFSYAAILTTLNLLVPIGLETYPKLSDWLQRIKTLPSYKPSENALIRMEEFVKSKLAK